jgi:hypothetical protein
VFVHVIPSSRVRVELAGMTIGCDSKTGSYREFREKSIKVK